MKSILVVLLSLFSAALQANEQELKPLWHAQAGAIAHRNIQYLAPTLHDRLILTSDTRGKIFAHGKKSGRLIWKLDTKERLDTAPAMNKNLVVAVTHSARVLAFNPENHQLLWSHSLSSNVLATPVIHDDKVIVKTVDDQLTVLSAKTGNIIWRYNHGTNQEILLHASSSPVVANGSLIVGFNDGNLFSFSLENGQVLWKTLVNGANGMSEIDHVVDVTAAPIVADNTIFVANYQGKIKALDFKTGQDLWAHDLSTYRPLSIDGKNVYAVDEQGQIWAFNRASGVVSWRQTKYKDNVLSAPTSTAKWLLVGDQTGTLHGFDVKDGRERFAMKLDRSAITAAPVIDNNSIYTISKRGELQKFDLG